MLVEIRETADGPAVMTVYTHDWQSRVDCIRYRGERYRVRTDARTGRAFADLSQPERS